MRHAAIGWLAILLAGCGGDPLFLMFEQHLITPEGEQPVGAGCESLDGSSGSGVGSAAGLPGGGASFSVEHQHHDGEGVRVIIRGNGGRPLAARVYDEDFLLSDEADEFEVALDAHNTLRLRYWGGTTCEPPTAFD